jgi:hypothetical protein
VRPRRRRQWWLGSRFPASHASCSPLPTGCGWSVTLACTTSTLRPTRWWSASRSARRTPTWVGWGCRRPRPGFPRSGRGCCGGSTGAPIGSVAVSTWASCCMGRSGWHPGRHRLGGLLRAQIWCPANRDPAPGGRPPRQGHRPGGGPRGPAGGGRRPGRGLGWEGQGVAAAGRPGHSEGSQAGGGAGSPQPHPGALAGAGGRCGWPTPARARSAASTWPLVASPWP